MSIEDYNEKSFVIRYKNDIHQYKDTLKALGGRWNPNLKGGAGWTFSKLKHTETVTAFLESLKKRQDEKHDIIPEDKAYKNLKEACANLEEIYYNLQQAYHNLENNYSDLEVKYMVAILSIILLIFSGVMHCL